MKIPTIAYQSGYKYQLKDTIHFFTRLVPTKTGYDYGAYVTLTPEGLLTIRRGYAWDGASGPAIDTNNIMRASLVHDALYQLIRLGHLDSSDRKAADKMLYDICRLDGMSYLRAKWVYYAVRWFGSPAAKPSAKRIIKYVPKIMKGAVT